MSSGKLPPGYRPFGPSTKPTVLRTGEEVAFEREALERAVASANSRFIPQPVEHLHYLPPIGRVAETALVEVEGHHYLIGRETPLSPASSEDLVLPRQALEDGKDDVDVSDQLSVSLATEPRNYEPQIFADMRSASEVELGEIALHSELPPLVWSFIVGGGGTVALYGAKVFMKEFLSKLGSTSAEAFTGWLSANARRARASEREQMCEFRFDLSSGITVLAFCPFSPHSQASLAALKESLEQLGDVAVYAGATPLEGVPENVKQVAFLWSPNEGWRLAWSASNTTTHVTHWFRGNAPDPERFLGYRSPTLRLLEPYMPELPGAATPLPVDDSRPDASGAR